MPDREQRDLALERAQPLPRVALEPSHLRQERLDPRSQLLEPRLVAGADRLGQLREVGRRHRMTVAQRYRHDPSRGQLDRDPPRPGLLAQLCERLSPARARSARSPRAGGARRCRSQTRPPARRGRPAETVACLPQASVPARSPAPLRSAAAARGSCAGTRSRPGAAGGGRDRAGAPPVRCACRLPPVRSRRCCSPPSRPRARTRSPRSPGPARPCRRAAPPPR